MINFYGQDFIWFTGVVEDRNDPLKLGRVRVRIHGLHTANTSDIPTSALPWAFPVMPVTSASMNGIGSSPIGPVEGTHVVGFFRDGNSCQEPVVWGTLGGIPQQPVVDTRGNNKTTISEQAAVFNNGTTPEGETVEPIKDIETNPNLDINLLIIHCTATKPNMDIGVAQVDRWHRERGWSEIGYHYVIRRNGIIEPGRDPSKQGAHAKGYNRKSLGIAMVGGIDNDGKPQNNFTAAQWASLETIVNKYQEQYPGIKVIGHNEVSNKACPSFDVQAWLSGRLQTAQPESVEDLHDDIVEDDVTRRQLEEQTEDTKDDLGETEAYADDVAAGTAVANPNYSETGFGFLDPNGVYPKSDFYGEADTSRLARNENIDKTIVTTKRNDLRTGIPIALGDSWDEPDTPYDALYPFNHVVESESGHVLEVDDTPGKERLHFYHKSGSYKEVHPDGSVVNHIVGENYHVIARGNNVLIEGQCNVTVGGDANILVEGNVNLESNGNLTGSIAGKVNFNAGGKIAITSDTAIKLKAPKIDLN